MEEMFAIAASFVKIVRNRGFTPFQMRKVAIGPKKSDKVAIGPKTAEAEKETSLYSI